MEPEMDPQVAWEQMLTAVSDRDWDQAEEFADALLKWMKQAGVPPGTACHSPMPQAWNRAMAEFGCLMALQYVRDARKRQTKRERDD
jgi:hypothetical protein